MTKPGWATFEAEMTQALAAAREVRDHLANASRIVDDQAKAGNVLEAYRDGQMTELYLLLDYFMSRLRAERKNVRESYQRTRYRETIEAEAE